MGVMIKKEDKDKIKLSLLTILCNASQIYRRTIPKSRKEAYKKSVKKIIKKLIEKTDNNSITNKGIRDAINELSKNAGISIGASQKAINVYLKFYCIVSNKADNIIKELDCPIDREVIKKKSTSKNTIEKNPYRGL